MMIAMASMSKKFMHSQAAVGIAKRMMLSRQMGSIAEGVEFDAIAREWRCKWSEDGDKKSLVEAQKALSGILPVIKSLDGVKSVHRIVCGGNHDFKVITTVSAGDKFNDWKDSGFAPESEFLKKLESIEGITTVETQTYTFMPM